MLEFLNSDTGAISLYIAALIVTVIAGIRLSKYGDEIAERSPLSGSFVGLVLLSGITSLPELISSAAAASPLIDNVNLIMGNIFGSNMFNIFIFFILDIAFGKTLVLNFAKESIKLNLNLTILLSVIIMGAILFIHSPISGGLVKDLEIPVIKIGLLNLLIFLLFLLFFYWTARSDKPEAAVVEEKKEEKDYPRSLGKVVLLFCFAALFIVAAGFALSYSGDKISLMEVGGKPLGASFVGTLLIAVGTSLPEIVVTLTAVFLKNFDMGIGNITGSNLFNLGIIFISDIVYRGGALLNDIELLSVIPAFFSIILMYVVVIAISFKSRKRIGPWSPGTLVIGIVYLFGMWVLYMFRG